MKKRFLGAMAALLALVAPAWAMAQGAPANYTLHAGDKIEVSVWKEPDLQRAVTVRPDGKFSFPLTGDLQAEGRTVDQVRADIETRLKRYIPEPVVTVTVVEVAGNRIYVIGQVARPGMLVMNPELNVLQALSLAGGPTPFAKLDSISVLRGSGASQTTLPFRYSQVVDGKSLQQNITLESGDVVVVP
jgi:polysaccharide export outer membrane protein